MNPLVVDKISKKFLWWKDSGFLYTKQLIESLPKTWRFTILVPKDFDSSFFGSDHIIDCIEYDYSTSIHQNRYHFNRNILAKNLPYGTDIDVVLNMQPEVAANLRVFFINQRREKPIIINYFHWIDCKESRKYAKELGGFINRQVEGFNAADLNLFHNQYAFELFVKSANNENLPHKVSDLSKVNFFHPLPTRYGMKPIDLPDKKIILFNHRLNNTTGWREVLSIFKSISRDDSVLWFTDEENLKVKKELEKEKNIIVKSIPFESYGYVLSKSHFSVCNLQEYATWNMAVLDSMNHGTIVLSNNTPLMKELNTHTTGNLTYSIKEMLDKDKMEILRDMHRFHDFDLESHLIDIISDRVDGKSPKKYEDVFDFISSNSVVEKREFVNKFWSFHANSNFQIIRWKLLCDDVIQDDTTKTLTTYMW